MDDDQGIEKIRSEREMRYCVFNDAICESSDGSGDLVSRSMKSHDEHGYVQISRSTKNHQGKDVH